MKKTKDIMLWVLSVFFLLLSLGLFTESFVSGFLMLLAAAICNPLVLKLIAKSGKKLKKKISIPAVIILFLAACVTAPSSDTAADTVPVETEAVSAPAEVEVTEAQEVEAADVAGSETISAEASAEKASAEKQTQSASEKTEVQSAETETEKTVDTSLPDGSELTVHYINVGQGDAALLSCDGEYMMIDAGDNDKGTAVQSYLTKQGVSKLKYMIGTHPDADHIGGMDVILYKFDCETVMMPNITNNTATYRDVIDTMNNRGYRNTLPKVGDTYSLGSAEFTILGPQKSYSDTNNSSIVLLLTHGENKFLFVGDAGEDAEQDLLSSGLSLDADVLKVGHHGSRYSSSKSFLQAVSPTYAVVSCAEGNSYGHPHAETLNNLRAMGVELFRTDEQGTIVATSDGKTITWNMSPSDTWKAGEPTGSAASDTKTKSSASTGTVAADSAAVAASDSGTATASAGATAAADSAAVTASDSGTSTASSGESAAVESNSSSNGDSNYGTAPEGTSYIGNKNNQKLHRASCKTLPQTQNQVLFNSLEEAQAAGFTQENQCKNCKPYN
jgi:competence protein ComEC